MEGGPGFVFDPAAQRDEWFDRLAQITDSAVLAGDSLRLQEMTTTAT
jgi:hypothetical protein